jgi:hypothetical protein
VYVVRPPPPTGVRSAGGSDAHKKISIPGGQTNVLLDTSARRTAADPLVLDADVAEDLQVRGSRSGSALD